MTLRTPPADTGIMDMLDSPESGNKNMEHKKKKQKVDECK